MKNLVLSITSNYDWYKLEPFIKSFKKYVKNADLVIFAADISEVTRATLQRGGVEIVPYTLNKFAELGYLRWTEAKKFLDERGDNYRQVFLTDLRDVVFQGDVFEKYADLESFLACATEGTNLNNSMNNANYKWVKNAFGQEEADKLADCEIICAGTVLATVDAMKILCSKMIDIVKYSTRLGDDQATLNYLVYENQLDIKNIVKSDCQSGNIFCLTFFRRMNQIKISDDKILRGDAGVPSAVHEYPVLIQLIQLVDKLYRDKNFQPDETFNDTRSMLEQIFYLVKVGRIDDAYKLFTKHLFGRNFVGHIDNLLQLWENTFIQNSAAELLALSVQSALPSAFAKGFNLGHVNKICALINFSTKTHRVISFNFKLFIANILYRLANDFYNAKQLAQCASTLEFISTLDIPTDKNFYLFQAKVYREMGRKADALAAYEKALNT